MSLPRIFQRLPRTAGLIPNSHPLHLNLKIPPLLPVAPFAASPLHIAGSVRYLSQRYQPQPHPRPQHQIYHSQRQPQPAYSSQNTHRTFPSHSQPQKPQDGKTILHSYLTRSYSAPIATTILSHLPSTPSSPIYMAIEQNQYSSSEAKEALRESFTTKYDEDVARLICKALPEEKAVLEGIKGKIEKIEEMTVGMVLVEFLLKLVAASVICLVTVGFVALLRYVFDLLPAWWNEQGRKWAKERMDEVVRWAKELLRRG